MIEALIYGMLIIVAYTLGLKIGQKMDNNTSETHDKVIPKVKLPKFQKKADRLKEEKERARYEAIISNIDNYNGDGFGQKDIPE